MNIIQKTSTVHTAGYARRPILYLTIHYTAGTSSVKGVARNVAAMFANPANRAASADFIVDDGEVVQYNPDILNRYCYAVGGAKYTVLYTKEAAKFYGKCKNYNSISIEICSSKRNKASLSVSDRDWYLTDAAVNNGVELARYLMQKYHIPLERVIMHHHVNGKQCPQPWCIDNAALAGWEKFKARLAGVETTKEDDDMTEAQTKQLINEAIAAIPKDTIYNTLEEVPASWGRATVEKLLKRDLLEGTGKGLGLSLDMLRTLVILDRAGVFD